MEPTPLGNPRAAIYASTVVHKVLPAALAATCFIAVCAAACQPAPEASSPATIPVASVSGRPPIIAPTDPPDDPDASYPSFVTASQPNDVQHDMAVFDGLPRCRLRGDEITLDDALTTLKPPVMRSFRGYVSMGPPTCTLLMCMGVDSAGRQSEAQCCNACGGTWSLGPDRGRGDAVILRAEDGRAMNWGAKDCHLSDLGTASHGIELVATGTLEELPQSPGSGHYRIKNAEVCVLRSH